MPAGVRTSFPAVTSQNRLFQETEPVGLPGEDVSRRGWVTRSTARMVCRHHRHGAAQGNASPSKIGKIAARPKHFHIALSLPSCCPATTHCWFSSGVCRIDSRTANVSCYTKMFARMKSEAAHPCRKHNSFDPDVNLRPTAFPKVAV